MPTPSDLPDALDRDHPTARMLQRVWKRLNRKNEHWMHCIVGREGSGKSHTALKLAELVDPEFSDDQVIFRPEPMLEMLRDETYEPGQVYILDESGVGLGKRTWADRAQVKLNQSLQLIRSHNLGLIFTLPRLSELDSQAQGRLHSYLEIVSKKPDQHVRGHWRWLDPDRVDITDNIYRSKPTFNDRDVDTVAFTPPEDEKMVANYETAKEEFQKEFYDEALDEHDDDDDGELKATDVADEILDEGGIEQYVTEINGGAQTVLDADLIGTDYDIGTRKASRVKKLLKRETGRTDLL
jgi:hypothetical protein